MAAKLWNDSVTSLFRIYFERNKDYRRCFHRHSKWQQKMKHIFPFIYYILMPTNSDNVEWHWSRRQFKLPAFCALRHFCDGVYFKSKFVWGWFVFIFMWTFQFRWKKNTTRIQQHDLTERRDHNMCAQLAAWKNSLNAQFHFFSFHSLKWTKPTKKKRKKWKEIKQKSEKEKQQLHCTGKWSSCCYVHNVRSFGTECIRNWWVWMNEWNERASKRVKEGVSEWSVWKCSTCAYLQLNEINLMREREVKKELVLSICSTFNLMW